MATFDAVTAEDVRDYLRSAVEVQANPEAELRRLGRRSFTLLPCLLEQYCQVLSEFDRVVETKFSSQLRQSVYRLSERIRSVVLTEPTTSVSQFRQAIAGYKSEFSESSIFVNALAQVQRNSALLRDPYVQMCLLAVSRLRRKIWRTMEHFWYLSDPERPRPFGIINPSLDMNGLLEDAIQRERNQFPIHFRFVEVDLGRDAPGTRICADEARLLNAFREIIRNGAFSTLVRTDAYRFHSLRGNSRVRVHASLHHDTILTVIRDNGVGMTESQLQSLRLFAYSENTNGVCFGGRGIGFATACQTMEEHGGQIQVSSDQSGTEVTASLPVRGAEIII
jgi:signal transduction histidine kinase